MKKKIQIYQDEPLGRLAIMPDFLPSPKELRLKLQKERIKVTVTLSKIG